MNTSSLKPEDMLLSVGVSYQEERSAVVACSVLDVGERLTSKCATGDVER